MACIEASMDRPAQAAAEEVVLDFAARAGRITDGLANRQNIIERWAINC